MQDPKPLESGHIVHMGSLEDAPPQHIQAPSASKESGDSPHDGGAFAWLQCAGAFFLFFNSWGLVNTFGVYQTFYERNMLRDKSPSHISWIGSLQAFLFVFGGVVAGPLYDHGYLQTLIRVGSFLVVFGMMMTSMCSTYWQVLLAQGLVIGFGNAALFVPSIALLPTYFVKRRALSTGIAITGGNLGGVVYSIVFHQLQPTLGFGWATRVIAFIMLGSLILPISCLRMRFRPSMVRCFFDTQAWTEVPFVIFATASFIGFLGLYIPYFYIESYALQKGIFNERLAFYLVPILNAGAFLGRIILGYFADRTGPVIMIIFCALGSATLGFAWVGITSPVATVVFCIIYGFFSGTFISLTMTIVAVTLCPNIGIIGLRLGMICIPASAGFLIGTPVGGAIVGHGWLGLQIFTGVTLAISTLGDIILRVLKGGWKLWTKC